jgi:hypothetical protein
MRRLKRTVLAISGGVAVLMASAFGCSDGRSQAQPLTPRDALAR